jgi:FemAB-related protein (PEP-CTERM system-associated)
MNAPAPLALTVRAADLRDPAECARLDGFVAEHPDGGHFHRPQWSRTVERGCGQRAHYLVAERGGALVGCLPLIEVRSPLFGNAFVASGFATGGGILADSDEVARALGEAGWALTWRHGCNSLELRGGPLPEGWTRQEGTYANFDRDLPGDGETLFASLPRRQRAEIRRAQRFELKTSVSSDRAHRNAHYRVLSESYHNLGTPVFSQRLFEAALDEYGADADILLVEKDGRPLAALLSLYFKGICQPFWGGGTAEAREWSANDLAYFELMRRAIERGCTRADFGRSKIGTGAWQRKRIWRFDETPLVYGVRTAFGAAPRQINPSSPRYSLQVAAWQKLPLGLASRLGPFIARGLG